MAQKPQIWLAAGGGLVVESVVIGWNRAAVCGRLGCRAVAEDRLLQFLPAGLPDSYRRAAEQAADFVIERVATYINERRAADPQFERPELPFGFLYALGAIGLLWQWENQGLQPFLRPDLPTADEARQKLVELVASDSVALLEFAVRLTNRVTDELWHLSSESDALFGAGVALGEFDEDLIDDKLAALILEILEAQQANL